MVTRDVRTPRCCSPARFKLHPRKEGTASPSADVVWFEERYFVEQPPIGEIRHSGVIVNVDGEWKLLQSVNSFPVPNEQVETFLEMMKVSMPRAAPAETEPAAKDSAEPTKTE